MAPPKRKGTVTPEKAESSTKRQTLGVPSPQGLAVPSPPGMTNSSSESPPSEGAITPRHNGTKQKSGSYKVKDIEYLWYECTVLVNTFGTDQPPLLRVLVCDDEDTLPVYGNKMEMDIHMAVRDREENWLNQVVTLQSRRDTRDELRRNNHYELVFIFLGHEGYPRGKEWFETNLLSEPAQGP